MLWSISDADDFSHYTVWAADQPIADLTTAWAAFGQDPERCGCLKINKQWVDEDFNPIEITLTSALYSGTTNMMDLTSATPQLIQPGIELFVVVTVHDLSGNVHLTDLWKQRSPQLTMTKTLRHLQDWSHSNLLTGRLTTAALCCLTSN